MMGDPKMEEEVCESPAGALTVTRKLTSTGARITTHINQESERGASPDSETRSKDLAVKADLGKEETAFDPETPKFSLGLSDDEQSIVKAEPLTQVSGVSREIAVDSEKKMSFDDFLKATNTQVMSEEECLKIEMEARLEKERSEVVENQVDGGIKNEPEEFVKTQIDARMESKLDPKPESDLQMVPWEMKEEVGENVVEATPLKCSKPRLTFPGHDPGFEKLGQKPESLKKKAVEDRSLSCVVIEDGDFPVDEDWLLVGGSVVNGLSTSKGRKLELNEVVHFNFSTNLSWKNNTQWIVRFSTKRNGEIGRLPMEWAKSVIPLVNSGRIKVFGRSIDVPKNLSMMQEILLYVSFFVHKSVLMVEGDVSSWKLDSPTYIDSTTHPLLSLFQLLSVKPSQGAQFTPEELDSRKRLRNPQGGGAFPQSKRIKGASLPPPPPQSSDEQTISESFLNKLVGAAEMYDLQEMEPPSTLMCDLRPYQKQALFWMTEAEKGLEFDKAPKTLHPCWAEYRVCDQRASTPIYVNIFSGEATTRFPSAMEMSRGGILADAMGLGKTVMTIALILARNGKGIPQDLKNLRRDEIIGGTPPRRAKGGTLIICPMALLSQWKDELETHSTEDSLSIFVHYGGGRTDDPRVMAGYDVVLTTYGTLQSCHKSAGDQSIYHRVDWHRIVLDEAHTIKCSRTQAAQAVFGLSAHCRWCLTGTPLQNNLEDLYSLLCFLHVEPWCNWAWWHKLIQKPYENGDHRGLKLVKAILRPLMLRRTKETKDNLGRPILVLPPTDIKTIECEQSEAEHDFYDALFRKSKDEFDQFVAAGKVLHNYANILELLLRLRQCCNHPFLVMSRGDTQKYSHLNKLAKYFINEDLEGGSSSNQLFPSRGGYEEQVAEMGKNTECPICLESPDDPVLTSCAHVMCRECLLASWGSNPQTGLCPLCRQLLSKTELITCPAESRFKLDVEKNWKESSKVSKLLECLEKIRRSGTGEKSIVFSQWTSFLDLLEIPMKRRNIGYLRYDGTLTQKHRERVLKEFNESNKKMVLLMSLRAGGVGLNLTAASNVFLMDPWWNPAVEEQAIMRIHRIGQKRRVLVRRFIVRDTVEERLQQVQAKKERMIAGALTDEEVRTSRLEDLKMLFR